MESLMVRSVADQIKRYCY